MLTCLIEKRTRRTRSTRSVRTTWVPLQDTTSLLVNKRLVVPLIARQNDVQDWPIVSPNDPTMWFVQLLYLQD